MGYDFDILYNPGVTNKAADALSRREPTSVILGTICSYNVVDWEAVNTLVDQDPFLSSIKQRVMQGETVLQGFSVEGGKLFYKGRFVLPKSAPFTHTLLKHYHDSPTGGHLGEHKTYHRLAQDWFWEGMKKQVVEYVKSCEVCQRQKSSSSLLPAGLFQPLLIPNQV